MFGSMGQTMKAASVLDGGIKLRMNPLQLRKAGAIIENMQDAGYNDEEINHICRALFLDQTEEDMTPAWTVFDKAQKGSLDAKDFKKVLPLMGEDVPEEEIERLFLEADEDGSGVIEFEEFCQLVRGMNPKPPKEEGGGMFGDMSLPDLEMPDMPAMPDMTGSDKAGESTVDAAPDDSADAAANDGGDAGDDAASSRAGTQRTEPDDVLGVTELKGRAITPGGVLDLKMVESTQVFGVPLNTLRYRSKGLRKLPAPVEDCMAYFETYKMNLLDPAIFSDPQAGKEVQSLRKAYDKGESPSLDAESTGVVSMLLLHFLESLPDALFPADLYECLTGAQGIEDDEVRITCFSPFVVSLPSANQDILQVLLPFFNEVAKAEENGCSARKLAKACLPGFLRHPAGAAPAQQALAEDAVETLISHGAKIANMADMTAQEDDVDYDVENIEELMAQYTS